MQIDITQVFSLADLNTQEVLVYNLDGGYTWVRQARDDKPTDDRYTWHARCHSPESALRAARAAGFNPTAIYCSK